MRDHRGRFVKRKRRNPLARTYKKKGVKKAQYRVHAGSKDLRAVRSALKDATKNKMSSLAARLKKLEGQTRKKVATGKAEDKKLRKQGYKRVGSQYQALRMGDLIEAIAQAKGKTVAKKKKKVVAKKKAAKKKVVTKKKVAKKKASVKKTSKKKITAKAKPKAAPKRRRRRSKKAVRFITKRQLLKRAASATRYKHPAKYRLKRKKGRYRDVRLSVSKIKRLRKNPIGGSMFEQYTGHTVVEAGGLALGGALYGAANGLLSRIPVVKTAHAALVKVPVVGSALPTLLLGALIHKLGSKQGIKALEVVGKGLVGASVVGMGVNASQMVPFLRPAPVSGVDYTVSGLPEGLGDADFGEIPFDGDAQMGELPQGLSGVDYTMSGVDYTMSGLGEESDFGEDSDFGEIPAGLGAGQMG